MATVLPSFRQGDIGGHVIGELHQFDLVALGFELRLDGVGDHVGKVANRGADDDLFLRLIDGKGGQRQAAGEQRQGGKGEEGTRAGLYFLRAIRICRHAKKHLHSKIITPASAFDFSPLAD